MRDFWCGPGAHIAGLARPLAGSSDTYGHSGRGPWASVNIVTVHDGFTLHDLVSHNHKHNTANREDNRDGEGHNRGWNCGVEGKTDDEVVLALRERQKRNLLATLFLSQGTPLLLAGDEMGRSQGGNNNGYCQDNAISWLNWQVDAKQARLGEFVHVLSALRRETAALRRSRFFSAEPDEHGHKDITWYTPHGDEMTAEAWRQPALHALSVMLCGFRIGVQKDAEPEPSSDSVLMLVNRHHEAVEFRLPVLRGAEWVPRLDTATASGLPAVTGPTPWPCTVGARSLVVLTQASG